MIQLLERLLGLERIRLAEGGPLSLQFAAPPAPWIMLAGAIIAGVLVWFVYHREPQPTGFRWMLALLRFGVVMTVLFVCGQPMLVLRRNHVDSSYVAVLIDQSASMAAHDIASSPAASQPADQQQPTRWEEAADVLTNPNGGLLHQLNQHHRVGAWLFSQKAEPLIVLDVDAQDQKMATQALEKAKPIGRGTDVAGAIAQVLKETQGNRVAGLVVVSDGRQTATPEVEDAVSAAMARSIPIHVVAVGSPLRRRDLRVASVWAPEDVFLRDTVGVRYEVEGAGVEAALPIVVELSDAAKQEVIATQTHTITTGDALIKSEFQYRPTQAGRRLLQVTVRPCEGEQELENNIAQTAVTAHDEKIGVLYVEDTPRFEYRYLKNLLLRETEIESSCLLLGATPGFPQEGSRPIRRFPQSIEELRPYDVIVLGDVDPRGEWLTPVQQSLLVDFVSTYGGGVTFLAGEKNMPQRLRQTPLEKLLPVEIDSQFYGRYDQSVAEDFHLQLTSEGRAHPMFQFERPSESRDSAISALPGFYWYARVSAAQPATSVLAVHPTAQSTGGPMPLAVLGRFGAGRTFYLGSDDLWRWRQDSGEVFYDTFWLQVLHTLARARKLGEGQPWRLETDRRNCEVGERVHVRLAAFDDVPMSEVKEIAAQVHDAANELIGRFILRPTGRAARVLEGVYQPRRAGTLVLSVESPSSAAKGKRIARSLSVVAGDVEQRHLEADHEYLQRLAKRTGGGFWRVTPEASGNGRTAPNLGALVAAIPDRSVQIADDIEEPLWDKGAILLLFITLIGTEWIMRRSAGMA